MTLFLPLLSKWNFFFKICVNKYIWDEEILFDLKQISFIKFERAYCFYDLHDPVISVEMHSFSDASNRMYSAFIHLCYERKSGLIKSALVCSKRKICFINGSVTIPRAKLSGVLLVCQLISSVLKALQSTLNICEIFYWTDSSIVLSWVINKDKVYKTYVMCNDWYKFEILLVILKNLS